MRMGLQASLLLCIIVATLDFPASLAHKKPTRSVEITAEEEKLRDPDGFAAIKELHRLMDDDQSGTIDRFESADFLKEDLKIGGGSDRTLRENAFHHNNDESITVDDLWEAWFQSEERDWTEQEMIDWLTRAVRLPQYAENFSIAKTSGIALPRMATQNSSYITNVLGIKNFVHRQKLQLKALDVVLFGFHDSTSRLKDVALAALVILLITVLIFFRNFRTRSERQKAELTSMLSELKSMENDFKGAEQKLDEGRERHQSAVESEHIEELKNQLYEAERRIEMNGFDAIPIALQPLLRRTYECESSYINAQKVECLNEMQEATDFVDKMRKKQAGLMASLKIVTGTTSGTDEIDRKIFALKARMEKIKLAMDECQQRWFEMESLCGFTITGPFGIVPTSPPSNTHDGGESMISNSNNTTGSGSATVLSSSAAAKLFFEHQNSITGSGVGLRSSGASASFDDYSLPNGDGPNSSSNGSAHLRHYAQHHHQQQHHHHHNHHHQHSHANQFRHSLSQQHLRHLNTNATTATIDGWLTSGGSSTEATAARRKNSTSLMSLSKSGRSTDNGADCNNPATIAPPSSTNAADSAAPSVQLTRQPYSSQQLFSGSIDGATMLKNLSDDSASLSSSNSRGFGTSARRKSRRLSQLIRRKLSKA